MPRLSSSMTSGLSGRRAHRLNMQAGPEVNVRERTSRRERPGSALAVLAAVLVTASACAGRVRPATRPSPSLAFVATAYCRGVITAAGSRVRNGVVAADPAVLPLGTVIRVAGLAGRYERVYTVLDTGRAIRGRRIDLYIEDCREAVRFGRRSVRLWVVRRAPGTMR